MLDGGELPGWVQKMMCHEHHSKIILERNIPISRILSMITEMHSWKRFKSPDWKHLMLKLVLIKKMKI